MASGGIRADILAGEGLTPGEDRVLRYTVVDANGDNVSDFSGWTFSWFMVARLEIAENLTNLSAGALLEKTTAEGEIDSDTEPYVDVTIDDTDTEDMTPGKYAYELWRTDAGNARRLAYGLLHLVY